MKVFPKQTFTDSDYENQEAAFEIQRKMADARSGNLIRSREELKVETRCGRGQPMSVVSMVTARIECATNRKITKEPWMKPRLHDDMNDHCVY